MASPSDVSYAVSAIAAALLVFAGEAQGQVLTTRISINQGMQDYSCLKSPFELAFELRDVDVNCGVKRIRTRKAWRYCADGSIYTLRNFERGWIEPPPLSEMEARIEKACSTYKEQRTAAAAEADEAREQRRQALIDKAAARREEKEGRRADAAAARQAHGTNSADPFAEAGAGVGGEQAEASHQGECPTSPYPIPFAGEDRWEQISCFENLGVFLNVGTIKVLDPQTRLIVVEFADLSHRARVDFRARCGDKKLLPITVRAVDDKGGEIEGTVLFPSVIRRLKNKKAVSVKDVPSLNALLQASCGPDPAPSDRRPNPFD